jgi:23S rRNA (uracil1939-C5)-methyltransferase/tRNA (uracil-5-)-methyltransferase
VAEFLEAGYRIERIQPFDLFPHTRHIENVISLVLPPENATV